MALIDLLVKTKAEGNSCFNYRLLYSFVAYTNHYFMCRMTTAGLYFFSKRKKIPAMGRDKHKQSAGGTTKYPPAQPGNTILNMVELYYTPYNHKQASKE